LLADQAMSAIGGAKGRHGLAEVHRHGGKADAEGQQGDTELATGRDGSAPLEEADVLVDDAVQSLVDVDVCLLYRYDAAEDKT
ncbi:hypothetical protein ACV357_34995, partial [Pseudomonas aeruginosa]